MTSPQIRIPADPLLECPTYGLAAETTDRFTLDGVPTAVEHVKIVCVKRHWYTLPVDRLPVSESGQPQTLVRTTQSGGESQCPR